ncbi:MAG: extracellular solute-binding protein [Spirochaetales bacterium]|nr:extracellular solute-binding protein [Spirochaetales bacterium]
MKRLPAYFIAIAACVVLITACSGGDDGDGAVAGDGTVGLRAFEGTTLNVLIKTGYESRAITEFQDDFVAATGIQLNIEVVDEPTLRTKFTLDGVSETGAYDVVATQFWYMPEYLRGGFLAPLDELIAESRSEWFAVDDIPESQKAAYRDGNGRLHAVPVSSSGGVLMYRTDLFEEYGIPTPSTTEDVLAAAAILRDHLNDDIVPFVGRGDSSSGSFGSSAGWAAAYGAAVLDGEGNVTIATDAMRRAIADWTTLMRDYGPADASVMGWDSMSEMFRQGRAAMNFDMSGFPAVYMDPEASQVADRVAVTTITGPAGVAAQWVYGEGLGITASSRNKEAAWLFIQWRTSLDVAIKEVERGLRTDFPLESIYTTPEYRERTADNDFARSIPAVMESVDFSYWPNVPQFAQLGQAFQSAVSLVIEGSMDLDGALAWSEDEIVRILAE